MLSNKLKLKGLVVTSVITLTACNSNVRHSMGIENQSPDAFRVVSTPPLTLPPDFSLAPPVEGAKALQRVDTTSAAEKTLFSKNPAETKNKKTQGEHSLLVKARSNDADRNIENILEKEHEDKLAQENEKSWLGKFVAWVNPAKKDDPVVNAKAEKKRIEEDQKKGAPVTGEDVQVIDKKSGGLLNRVIGQ